MAHRTFLLTMAPGWTKKKWPTTERAGMTTAEMEGVHKGLTVTRVFLVFTDKRSLMIKQARRTTEVAMLKVKVRAIRGLTEPPHAALT